MYSTRIFCNPVHGNGFGSNWETRLETKRRASFDDIAKFENEILNVDVPKEKSWGQLGLSSKNQLLWLDQFGTGAEKRLMIIASSIAG